MIEKPSVYKIDEKKAMVASGKDEKGVKRVFTSLKEAIAFVATSGQAVFVNNLRADTIPYLTERNPHVSFRHENGGMKFITMKDGTAKRIETEEQVVISRLLPDASFDA